MITIVALRGFGACLTMVPWTPAIASAPNICDAAAHRAALKTGVPVSVLLAITRNETGRSQAGHLQPWPWTVNMEGVGKWFPTRQAAQAYADRNYQNGSRSFDVGCFQLNYKWHGVEFASISDMFDPDANALYAARFMKRLFAEKADWSEAAGAYHSRTKRYAEVYQGRFDRILRTLHGGQAGTIAPPVELAQDETARRRPITTAAGRTNTYFFFRKSGGVTGYGSLVPLADADTGQDAFLSINGA